MSVLQLDLHHLRVTVKDMQEPFTEQVVLVVGACPGDGTLSSPIYNITCEFWRDLD